MASEKEYPLIINDLKIDPLIFTQGFVPRCDIDLCSGQCCDWGVLMDLPYREEILKFENEIISEMDEQQVKDSSKWFDNIISDDHDFPSKKSIGTDVYNTSDGRNQCIFKTLNNYCTLQNTAVNLKLHKWAIKPLYCILYPITIVDNILTYDTDHSENLDYCGMNCSKNFTTTVIEAMQEELKHLLGESGFNTLYDYYLKNYKEKFQIKF